MNNDSGKLFNGFLLGVIIGAGAVFLLGTEKGKKILKNLSEEGLGNLDDILEEGEEFEEEGEKQEMKYPASRRFFRRSKT